MNKFINLHNHFFSFFDAYETLEEKIKYCASQEFPALAITDHNSLSGIVYFYEACLNNKIKPLLGIELNYYYNKEEKNYYHIILLAKNLKGLQILTQMLDESYNSENFYYKPRFPFKRFKHYDLNNIICTTACIKNSIYSSANKEEEFLKLKETFPNFYLEFQPHKDTYETFYKNFLLDIQKKYQQPFILSSDSHYLSKEDALYHKFFAFSSMKKSIYDENAFEYFKEDNLYLMNDEDVYKEFNFFSKDFIEEGIENTKKIADEIELYEIRKKDLQIPNPFEHTMTKEKINEILKEECFKALENYKIENKEVYLKRLEEEFEVILPYGFAKYFLCLKKIVEAYKEEYGEYSVGLGRGSAAGSLVAFLMGITKVDPIKYNLSFTRFLNKYRVVNQKLDI